MCIDVFGDDWDAYFLAHFVGDEPDDDTTCNMDVDQEPVSKFSSFRTG